MARLSEKEVKSIKEFVSGGNSIVTDMIDTIETQQQEIEQLQKEIFSLMQRKSIKENKQLKVALDKGIKGLKSIVNDYESDFTEFELEHDLCPREEVVLKTAREALTAINEVREE